MNKQIFYVFKKNSVRRKKKNILDRALYVPILVFSLQNIAVTKKLQFSRKHNIINGDS